MDVKVEDLGPCKKRLSVTVSKDRVQKHVEEVFRSANQQVRMKGFRPGRIPKHVLRAQVGDSVLAQAKEGLISETFGEALRSQELDIIGNPKLDVSEEPLDEGKELQYTVDCELRPEVKVGDIKSMQATRNPTEPTEEEIESAIQQLAQSKRKLEKANDAELSDGDFAKVNMSYQHDGAEALRKEGLQLSTRIPVRGCDPEIFAAKLTGLSVGEKAEIEIEYPEAFEKEELRGKQGTLEIEILEIQRFTAPEIDDEFAKGFEFETAEELKAALTDRIREEKERQEDHRIEEEILSALYAENSFELPQGLIEDETNGRLKAYAEELAKNKAPEEEIQKRVEAAREEAGEAARLTVRNLFLVEAIGKKEKLFVTEDDTRKELVRIAAENNVGEEEVRAHFEKEELMPELRLDLMNRKVREFLKETATITDSKEASA